MTAARVGLGAAAIVAALNDELTGAAGLVTIGAVADGLDGHLARWLHVASPVGALFDYFADYLCFVVAPWMLSRALLDGALDPLREALLGLPLLTGALRYARNGARVAATADDPGDLPGVGTIFYAFVPVVAVFLELPAVVGGDTFSVLLPAWVAALAVLMIAPIRYPKLARFAGASPVVLVLLACMPFVGSKPLAGIALVLGVLYIGVAPVFSRTRRGWNR